MPADFDFVLNYPVPLKRKPSVTSYKFGDGYSQRVGSGLNSNLQSWDVKASSLDTTTAIAIDSFLSTKGGTASFTWVNPMGETINVICSEWNITFDDDSEFSATFEQVP